MLFFFLNGTIIEAQNLANMLHQYCFASGQAINLNKSSIYFGKNCPPRPKTKYSSRIESANHGENREISVCSFKLGTNKEVNVFLSSCKN